MKGISTLKFSHLSKTTAKELSISKNIEKTAPKATTVQSLLNFSKSLCIQNSKIIGNFELVMS